ncbi:hypothetical protein [Roseiflexus sp.]
MVASAVTSYWRSRTACEEYLYIRPSPEAMPGSVRGVMGGRS